MVPSEAEIEARLAELRRRREAIDREIADHLLYLELGRRLRAGAAEAGGPPVPPGQARQSGAAGADADPGATDLSGPDVPRRAETGAREAGPVGGAPPRRWTPPEPASGAAAPPPPSASPALGPVLPSSVSSSVSSGEAGGEARGWAAPAARPSVAPASVPPSGSPGPGWPSGGASGPLPRPEDPPPPVSFEEDPAGARRYGRALVEAAVAVLAEAGRPMHAGEILEHLAARGFGVPGQDPVAALNTRLWKRSGPGGPLRRLGDAVYDRAGASGPA